MNSQIWVLELASASQKCLDFMSGMGKLYFSVAEFYMQSALAKLRLRYSFPYFADS